MNNVFWLGVYPGLTTQMLDYMADAVCSFVREQDAGLAVLNAADSK